MKKSEKKWIITLLLCIFAGVFGAHSFYAGRYIKGTIQLLTGGGCFIMQCYDFIMIILKKFKDGEGKVICE